MPQWLQTPQVTGSSQGWARLVLLRSPPHDTRVQLSASFLNFLKNPDFFLNFLNFLKKIRKFRKKFRKVRKSVGVPKTSHFTIIFHRKHKNSRCHRIPLGPGAQIPFLRLPACFESSDSLASSHCMFNANNKSHSVARFIVCVDANFFIVCH